MLGRLFSSAGGHGRSPSSLESATEEQHTRNLLFFDSPPLQGLNTGPRFGSFDDHNGFDVREGDIRILIAQNAYADQDRPSILFDTSPSKLRSEKGSVPQSPKPIPTMRHERTTSSIAPTKSYFTLQPDTTAPPSPRSPPGAFQTRSRGSTTSGGQPGHQSASLREAESKDVTNEILACAFGASSSTKSGTRMHVIRSSNNKVPRVPSNPVMSPAAVTGRNAPKPTLVRAQTSGLPFLADSGPGSDDLVLITRLFTVAPPDLEKDASEDASKLTATLLEDFISSPGRSKPPKLREKKTLAYCVCLVVEMHHQGSSRPLSRHGFGGHEQHHSPPTSSSFGSDLQSSWTFLDALPPSLSSSRSTQQSTIDGHVEFVLHRWDVMIRHLSIISNQAKEKIFGLLSQIDDTSSGRKTPKEKRMQRINQKVIRLPPFSLVDDQELQKTSFEAASFIRSALSIPSVRPLPGGHWFEEARLVARLCGQRGNDKFLAILLSTFLGNNFEWINEIGQEIYENQLLLKRKSQQERSVMRSRTVIICEDRILARRLVFLLASFLMPGMLGLKPISSLGAHLSHAQSQHHQTTISRSYVQATELSTSVSSTEEERRGRYTRTNRRKLERTLSETSSLRTAHLSIPQQESSLHKTSAGTTTTVTPSPSTPLAYVSSSPKESSGYFPSTDIPSSAAAASLQRIRRSSSSASSIPSTWGSLLGSIWSNKQTSSLGTSNTTGPSETMASTINSSRASQYQRPLVNQLESMAKEVGVPDSPIKDRHKDLLMSQERMEDIPPRLEVDEKEGVVDVDLKMPNSSLRSYGSSPDVFPAFPTPLSTSTASLDDARSFYSVRSNSKTSSDRVNNVAGYLKQYHPDFVLQAVRACSEKDVREGMIGSLNANTEDSSPSSSYDECNTLIADTRNYSVKCLTLRRKARISEKTLNTKQSTTSSPWQDEFSMESMLSYDDTLGEALERALDGPSTVSSRMPSPSPSKTRHLRTVSTSTASTVNAPSPLANSFSAASTMDTLQPVPRRHRGQLILEALKDVVGEVDRDLHDHNLRRSENIPVSCSSGPSILTPQKREENVLRDGVRRWLQGAVETSVW